MLSESLAPRGGDALYTMAQDGSDVRRLQLNVPGSAISPAWSPDGKHVVFSVEVRDTQSIWTADADGKNAKELFHCAGACLGADYPAWSPEWEVDRFHLLRREPGSVGGAAVG